MAEEAILNGFYECWDRLLVRRPLISTFESGVIRTLSLRISAVMLEVAFHGALESAQFLYPPYEHLCLGPGIQMRRLLSVELISHAFFSLLILYQLGLKVSY